MDLKSRLRKLEALSFEDDTIDLEKWNAHPDELIFEGWDEKENINKEVKNELNRKAGEN